MIELYRGKIQVSEVRMEDGFIRIEKYRDTLTNVERALGFRFGEGSGKDTVEGSKALQMSLDKVEFSNILILGNDQTNGDEISLLLKLLENRLEYLPERVDAELNLEVELNHCNYKTYIETLL